MLNIDDEKPAIQVAENVTPLRQGPETDACRKNRDRSTYEHDHMALDSQESVAHIDSGRAFIIAQPGTVESEPKGPLDRAVAWLIKGITSVSTGKIGSAEQRKRNEEYEGKLGDAIRQTIGERVKDMVKVMVLATESESQGQDYDGILLDSVTSLADLMGQASMVQCSDLHKIGFYKAHRSKSVADVVLGDQNPRWHDVPVTINIMIREPGGK